MLKNRLPQLVIINTLLIAVLVVFFVYKEFITSEKTVYVDNIKLFDGFNMTKEMKAIGENGFKSRKNAVDSLYKKLENTNDLQEKKAVTQDFINLREEFNQFNQNFAQQETVKIWARMNSYINEFSAEKNYTIIIGSENRRDVLFADKKVDITDELISYINKKYEGNK